MSTPSSLPDQGIKGNEEVFATDETGDKGQFLGSDPNFGFYDEEIAQNLGLDFEFVYSGSETGSLAALDKAFANQDPLLMYFWAPHWAQQKYDLVEVELPPVRGQRPMRRAIAKPDADGYACDYADDVLYKAFSAQLEDEGPGGVRVPVQFPWTEEDQNSVALAINDGTDPRRSGPGMGRRESRCVGGMAACSLANDPSAVPALT